MPQVAIESADRLLGGLVTDVPSHSLARGQSPDAINFDPSASEGVVKRAGFARYIPQDGGTGLATGLFASTMTSGSYPTFVLCSHGTDLEIVEGPAWTTISGTTITNNTPVDMLMFDDKYIILNEGGGPWKWDGVTAPAPNPQVTDLGLDAPNQAVVATCTLGVIHKSRLWLSGRASDPSKVFWSGLHDPTKWVADPTSADAGNENVYKNDGMIVNGLSSNGDILFVSKIAKDGSEGSLYGYMGADPNGSVVIRRLAHFGAVSHRAMLSFDGVMIIADNRGIHSISGKGVALLSRDIQNIYLDIPDKSTIILGRYLNQLWVAYDSNGNGTNDSVFVLDLGRGRWSKYTGTVGNIGRMVNHPTTGKLLTTYSDSNTLFINQQVEGTHDLSDAGAATAIQFYWSTPDLDWQTFYQDKIVKNLYLYTEDTGNFDITVSRTLDGEPQTDVPPITVNVQAPGAITKKTTRTIVPSSDRNSRFTRFTFTNSDLNEPIIIYAYSSFAEVLEPSR